MGSNQNAKVDSHGLTVLQPETPQAVMGSWRFEDVLAQDDSGNGNNLSRVPPAGPGFLRGSSGKFDGRMPLFIPHIEKYETPTQTISLWIYLLEDVRDAFRVILDKAGAFSLRVWPDTRTLRLIVDKKSADARASLPLHRWTHLAIVFSHTSVQLYVNGVQEVSLPVTGAPWIRIKAPIYLASAAPQNAQQSGLLGVSAFIDNVLYHSVALPASALKALGSTAFAGLPGSGDGVWFGCENCVRASATKICTQDVAGRPKSHVCTSKELASSAMLVARSMGWLDFGSQPVHDFENTENVPETTPGIGLCCPNE